MSPAEFVQDYGAILRRLPMALRACLPEDVAEAEAVVAAIVDAVGDVPIGMSSTGSDIAEEELAHLAKTLQPAREMVNHPKHYNSHPSGVECIVIIETMPFNIGTAIKHLWRCDLKHDTPMEDLRKAHWYIGREIERLGKASP
jgi:hypothetical protein